MDHKERKRLLETPLDVFPRVEGIRYGARDHQKPVFINNYSFKTRLKRSQLPLLDPNRLHTHGQDILLCIGGNRSGKTVAAIACGAELMIKTPGVQGLVGTRTYQDLNDTLIEPYRKIFTVNKPWDHPFVEQRPTEHRRILRLINGSFVRFIQFEDFERLRGREADFIHMDEASQLDDPRAYYECIRRSSGTRLKTRQFILTTNPPESADWLYDIFNLDQLKPGYDGEIRPIGEPCKCQFCYKCLKSGWEVEWAFDEEGNGTCSHCGTLKDNDCVGNQNFIRVVQSDLSMNDTVPSDMHATMKATMDANTYALYGLGQLIELRQGKVYKPFESGNILPFEKPVDETKPIIWTFDFNISYQCSAIIQTIDTVNGMVAEVLDEIVLPECGPEAVAKVFIKKYPEYCKLSNPYAQPILLYGDPAGLNKATDRNEKSKFQIIYDILHAAGYDVQMMVKKQKGNTQIPVMLRIDSVNGMLCNAEGLRRLFINRSCVYTKKSFEGVKYKEKVDPPAIDKQCDDNAARNPDKMFTHLLTHITDAIGYWVAKVNPVIKDHEEKPWVQFPGDEVITATDKTTIHKDMTTDEPERPRTLSDEIDELGGFGRNPFGDFWTF